MALGKVTSRQQPTCDDKPGHDNWERSYSGKRPAHLPGNTSIRVSRGSFAHARTIAAVSLISTALKVKRSSALHSPIPRLLRETRFSLELR
jgi:hypothetical protein